MTKDEFIQRAVLAMAGNKDFVYYGKLRYSEIVSNAVALADRVDEEVIWD